MENRYQKLTEGIHTPVGLNDRVLFEARRRAAETPPRRERQHWGRPLVRTAVCAACALALLLGGFSLRPAPAVESGNSGESAAPADTETPVLVPTFGLTAYAAGTGEAYPAGEDGTIAFAAGDGMANPDEGDFTGCLFQLTGDDIAYVTMSVDRGGLYRYRIVDHLTDEQMAYYREHMGTPELATASIGKTDEGVWYMPEMSALGESVREDYDPEVRYGFWVPPEEMILLGEEAEPRAEHWANIDIFDGAVLTVTAVFENGGERTQVYRLHTGNLKVDWTEAYVLTVLPELAEGEDPFVHGIYAVPED